MSDVQELLRRTERLRGQMDLLRRELEALHQDLLQLRETPAGEANQAEAAKTDCLAVALALARDLGDWTETRGERG